MVATDVTKTVTLIKVLLLTTMMTTTRRMTGQGLWSRPRRHCLLDPQIWDRWQEWKFQQQSMKRIRHILHGLQCNWTGWDSWPTFRRFQREIWTSRKSSVMIPSIKLSALTLCNGGKKCKHALSDSPCCGSTNCQARSAFNPRAGVLPCSDLRQSL